MACLGEKAGLLAAVEPDVEKVVHDFIVVEPVIRTKQRLVIRPEPRICAAGLERLNDAGVDLGIVQILAALAVHIQRDWHTPGPLARSEEQTSELQSLMRISSAVFSLKQKKRIQKPKSMSSK